MTQTGPTDPRMMEGSSNGRLDDETYAALDRAVEQRRERLVKIRRRLHATPEASEQERETTAFIAETLAHMGHQPRVMQSETGLLVDIDLGAPDHSFIALRAELDAVGVNDDKQTAYASTRPGLCHACGHDVHSTVLMGVASVLAEKLDDIRAQRVRHNLRLIFQPAEEIATGARAMIKQGALNGVEAILCLHVDPFLDVGRIGVRTGPITAGCKSFRVHIRGRGGHTARPFESIDPIPAATTIVDQFYTLCPRSVDARRPMVLTVASISTGTAVNAIPDEATIQGTLRTLHAKDAGDVQRRMQAICDGTAQATGCDVELQFHHFCPPTNNDAHLADLVISFCREQFGEGFVHWVDEPSMGGEDFAFYQELIPGLMVRLGTALSEPKLRRPLHSSHFDINEEALPIGVRYLVRAALRCAERFEPEPS